MASASTHWSPGEDNGHNKQRRTKHKFYRSAACAYQQVEIDKVEIDEGRFYREWEGSSGTYRGDRCTFCRDRGVFVLFPNLAPWTTLRAELKDTEVGEHNVSLVEYEKRDRVKEFLDRGPEDTQESISEPADMPSNVIKTRLDAEGYQGIPLLVVWTLYDDSGTRVPESWFQDEFGYPIAALVPENRVDVSSAEILIPLPPKAGTYYVNIELWDKGDEDWFDEQGNSVVVTDEHGDPKQYKTWKCRLVRSQCETPMRLSSINTEEFHVTLDSSGKPRSTRKTPGSDSSNGAAETKSGGAGPVAAPKSSGAEAASVPKSSGADAKASSNPYWERWGWWDAAVGYGK